MCVLNVFEHSFGPFFETRAQKSHAQQIMGSKHLSRLWARLVTFLGLSIWISGNMAVLVLATITLLYLPKPWAVALLAIQIAAVLTPLDIKPPALIARFLAFSVRAAHDYFPIQVVYEDREAFQPGTPYVIGFEPHSVLPLGLSSFTQLAPGTPEPLKGYVMGTSTVFIAPFMRHMCWWSGVRAVSRKVIKRTLASGMSCALCPGGVQECLYMREGTEVVFLKKRTGFVRLALEQGAPLVPVFAFGQTPHYSYARPFIDFPKKATPSGSHPISRFARLVGYVPMLVWGWGITAMPRRVPMYVAVAPPIVVPRVEHPSPTQVHEYLGKFISEIERLFEEHKAAAGYPQEKLIVY